MSSYILEKHKQWKPHSAFLVYVLGHKKQQNRFIRICKTCLVFSQASIKMGSQGLGNSLHMILGCSEENACVFIEKVELLFYEGLLYKETKLKHLILL